jgi:hypothetical protein
MRLTTPKRAARLALAAALVLLGQSQARAQHSHTMAIESDASDGGQLQLGWDFDGTPIARTSDAGLAGVFTGNVPGLNDGAGDGTSTFPLSDGTDVDVEVTAMDAGLRWIFPSGTLEEAGDSTFEGTMPNMHNHATFELNTTDANQFAEGRISFRVVESTAVPFGYTPSDVKTLIVSNGYLPPFETASATDLRCQKAVAGAAGGFSAKTYQALGKCLDAALAHVMLGRPAKPALQKCGVDEADARSLFNLIATEKGKAVSKIARQCGALSDSSLPYTESQINTHLGMVQCRAEELAGAAYNHAADLIGDVLEAAGKGDHHDVQHAFPCMKASIE